VKYKDLRELLVPGLIHALHFPFCCTLSIYPAAIPSSDFAMVIQPKLYQFLVGLFASLGSLLYGYDLGVIAQVIASKAFNSKFKPTDDETGAVVSVFTGGAFFGAAFAGPVGDFIGRRLTIMTGAIVRPPKAIHFSLRYSQ
jgi:hypothetical protein